MIASLQVFTAMQNANAKNVIINRNTKKNDKRLFKRRRSALKTPSNQLSSTILILKVVIARTPIVRKSIAFAIKTEFCAAASVNVLNAKIKSLQDILKITKTLHNLKTNYVQKKREIIIFSINS